MNLIRNITSNQGFHDITPTEIVIHWWGDPTNHPTLEGVVSWFKNPKSELSAHYVVSDTTVVQMVEENHRAWHAMSANDYAIGIEVDPNTPGDTYNTVIQLIKDIYARHGQLPIIKHGDVPGINTSCPGTLDVELIVNKVRGANDPMVDENFLRAFWIDLFNVLPNEEQKRQYLNRPVLEVYNELRNSDAHKARVEYLVQIEKDAYKHAARVKELEEGVAGKVDKILTILNKGA